MESMPDRTDTDLVFDAFMHSLKGSFPEAPWDDVEAFAERIWGELRMTGDPDWESLRDRARAAWRALA